MSKAITVKTFLPVVILLLLHQTCFSQAQNQVPVNLSTILKLAGANNLTIKQYQLEYQESLAEIDKAKEWYLPQVFLGPTFHYLKGATIQTSGELLADADQKELWLGGGLFGQWDFGDGIYNVMAKRQQSEAVKAMSQAQRNNVILNAISDYFDLQTTQFSYFEMLSLLEEADTFTNQLKVQVDAGLRYQSEYLLAQSNLDHIRIQLNAARTQMFNTSHALLNILNIDTSAILISSDKEMVPIEVVKNMVDTSAAAFNQYYQNRPEYKSMLAQLNSIQDEKKTITTGIYIPRVVVGTPDALLGTFGAPYNNSYHLDGGVQWDIPLGLLIYNGDVKIYNSQIQIEQNQMQQFNNQVHQQVDDARWQIIIGMQQMKAASKSVDESKKALDQSIERERLGTVRPFEVFQTEQFYIQAESDYLKAVSDYNKAQYQLYVAMGNNL